MQKGTYLHKKFRKRIIKSWTVGDSMNHSLSLFSCVKLLGFTDSQKIADLSGFKLTGISSIFLYQLSNTSSQITRSYTSLRHMFTRFFTDANRWNPWPNRLPSKVSHPVHF